MQIYDKKYYLCRGYKLEKTNKQLIYYHIPKTGGTTICNILNNLFKSSFRIKGSPTNERGGNSAFEFFCSNKKKILNSNFDFIYGHFQYCISNYFPNRLSITTLRNPVERCISHYNMIVERNLLDRGTGIEECFKKNLIPSNMITQIFSGNNNADLKINNNKLDVALSNITKNIDYLFDIKDIANLLNLIISLYNMPNLFFQKLQQSKKNYFAKDEKSIDIIKKYNEFDIEMYSYLNKNKYFTEITNLNRKRTKSDYFIYSLDFQVNDKQTIVVDEKKMISIMQYLKSKNFDIIETS